MKMLTASALLAAATAAPGLADGLEPGSVLVFPFHRSSFGQASTYFTAVAVTNTNLVPISPLNGLGGSTNAHFEYVNVTPNPDPAMENMPLDCQVADTFEFLTPADVRAVLTSCHNGVAQAEGYLVVSATDPNSFDTAWSHNYLVGSELVVSSDSGVWYLNAIPFKAIDEDGAATDHDLDMQLDFDNIEYEGIPDHLIIDSFVADVFPNLILINLSGGTAFKANVAFDVFNDNEQPLSATYSFQCWVEVPLVAIGQVFDPLFLANNMNNDPSELDVDCDGIEDANTGWARIRGVNHFSSVETCPDAALLGAVGQGSFIPVGARRLWESREKQFDGDFLKTGTDDPECGQANTPPVCDAGPSQNGNTGETITFDGSGSFDPDGGALSFSWNFGDGSMGTGAMPSHVYGTAGDFVVTLTVTDNEGRARTCTTSADIQAANQAPVCDAGPNVMGQEGESVMFDGSGSFDPDGGGLSFSWNFGDGSMGSGAMPSHTYAAAGDYTATLTVTDNEGRSAMCMTNVDISPSSAPVCIINTTPPAGPGGAITPILNQPVSFSASASFDPDGGSIVDVMWDFGDGATAMGTNVMHAFSQEIAFTVTLTVTDDEGDSSSCTLTVIPNG